MGNYVSRLQTAPIDTAFSNGKAEGKAEGLAEGEKRKALETARAMLADGMALETVLKYTGLTAADVAESVKLN